MYRYISQSESPINRKSIISSSATTCHCHMNPLVLVVVSRGYIPAPHGVSPTRHSGSSPSPLTLYYPRYRKYPHNQHTSRSTEVGKGVLSIGDKACSKIGKSARGRGRRIYLGGTPNIRHLRMYFIALYLEDTYRRHWIWFHALRLSGCCVVDQYQSCRSPKFRRILIAVRTLMAADSFTLIKELPPPPPQQLASNSLFHLFNPSTHVQKLRIALMIRFKSSEYGGYFMEV